MKTYTGKICRTFTIEVPYTCTARNEAEAKRKASEYGQRVLAEFNLVKDGDTRGVRVIRK